jgi:hypothetical protein
LQIIKPIVFAKECNLELNEAANIFFKARFDERFI